MEGTHAIYFLITSLLATSKIPCIRNNDNAILRIGGMCALVLVTLGSDTIAFPAHDDADVFWELMVGLILMMLTGIMNGIQDH